MRTVERDLLAKVLHEKVTMPGHAYPGAPWNDACDELADQLLDAVNRALDAAPGGLDEERLAVVLQDWMPDGAGVSVGFDGETAHLVGGDLARFIFDRAAEYARLSEQR